MKNLIEVASNKALNEIIETAIKQAIILQVKANREYAIQKELESKGKKYNYMAKHIYEQGAHGCCEILWKFFGGYGYQHHNAIAKICECKDDGMLGSDCQDYVQMYIDTFEAWY